MLSATRLCRQRNSSTAVCATVKVLDAKASWTLVTASDTPEK